MHQASRRSRATLVCAGGHCRCGDPRSAVPRRLPSGGDMTGAPEVALPGTLSEAIRAQFGRSFRSPYETPIVVVANGLLMTGAWFLLPSPNVLFTLHGALAFPMILASWMFSDVPATNVLGPDPGRAMTALTDPTTLRRLLYAKN